MILNVVDARGIADAFATAKAGDIISIADGTHKLPAIALSRAGGTRDQPILVTAQNRGRAVLETSGFEEAILLGHPYWRIDGLTIRATAGSNYAIKLEGGALYCTIRGCTLEIGPASECGIKGAGAADPRLCPDGATIEDNTITMPIPTAYGLAEGVDAVACDGWIVRGNRIRGFRTAAKGPAFGVVIKGNASGAIIERNTITECFIGISPGGGGTGAQWMRNGVAAAETRGAIVRENVVADTDDVSIYCYSANATRIQGNYLIAPWRGKGGSSIDVRNAASTADIVGNFLDGPIRNRDGGTHGSRSNILGPPAAMGRLYFTPA